MYIKVLNNNKTYDSKYIGPLPRVLFYVPLISEKLFWFDFISEYFIHHCESVTVLFIPTYRIFSHILLIPEYTPKFHFPILGSPSPWEPNCSCSHYVAGTGASPEPSIILFSPLPMLPLNHPLQPSQSYGPTSTSVINPLTPKPSSLSITSPTRSHFLLFSFCVSLFFFFNLFFFLWVVDE